MTAKKIAKLRQKLEALKRRKRNLKPKEMVRFAVKIGRYPDTGGKHPTYMSRILRSTRGISIPSHGSRSGNLAVGTAGNIIDQFEADLDRLEELADMEGKDNGEEETERLP